MLTCRSPLPAAFWELATDNTWYQSAISGVSSSASRRIDAYHLQRTVIADSQKNTWRQQDLRSAVLRREGLPRRQLGGSHGFVGEGLRADRGLPLDVVDRPGLRRLALGRSLLAYPNRSGMWTNYWRNAGWKLIIRPCGAGYSAIRPNWNSGCGAILSRLTNPESGGLIGYLAGSKKTAKRGIFAHE